MTVGVRCSGLRLWRAGALLLLATAACAPTKDALVLLKIDVAADVPPIAAIQVSVPGNAAVRVRTVNGDPRPNPLYLGYYIGGVTGQVTLLAQARNAAGCAIGEAQPIMTGVESGKTTAEVALTIAALPAPVCPADGGADRATTDGGSGGAAGDGGSDGAPPVGPKRARGEACTQNAECALGRCVDGVCCESACSGTCESCGEPNQKGTCVAVAGEPRGTTRPRCAGAGTACGGMCDGSNRTTCAYPDERIVCAGAGCQSGMATDTRTCDRAGACRGVTPVACASSSCADPNRCANGCDTAAGTACPQAQFCNGAGACENKIGNGEACSNDAHCVSGSCIDGRCCSSPACGSCQQCTGPGGTCVAVASKDDADSCIGDRTCDGAGVCKAKAGKSCTTASECSTGNCVDGHCCTADACGACQSCTGGGGDCVPVTAAEDDDSCKDTKSCDLNGECRSKQGQTCTTGADCLLGYCVDGVCCESACGGQCESCAESNQKGTCALVIGNPRAPRAACPGGATTCGGACDGTSRTSCVFPGAGVTCGASTCAAGMATASPTCDSRGGCTPGTAVACSSNQCADATRCSGGCDAVTAPCQSGFFCTSAGACQPKIANGAVCSADGQCTSAHCVDGRCCGVESCGACQSCTGAAGTCVAITGADDPGSCAVESTCDATGKCKVKPGNACSANEQCATGNCVDGRCCGVSACGKCQACTGGGGVCVGVMGAEDPDSCTGAQTCDALGTCKTKQGQTCTRPEDCIGGHCADGVCCESDCTGRCEACNEGTQKGMCVAVMGAPRGVRMPCLGGGTACAGACNGTNPSACAYPDQNTTCGNPLCMSGIATPAPTCDRMGGCRPGTSTQCMSNLCASNTTCAGACNPTTAPCPGNQFCNVMTGACVVKAGNGGTCTTGDQCTSGNCVDSRCCGATACGPCAQCTGANGTCVAINGAEDPDSCMGTQTCDAMGACKSKPGQMCTVGSQCTTGSCVDGRCCGSSACPRCQDCTGGGGTCVGVTGDDPDPVAANACTGTQICDAQSLCKTKQGSGCSIGADCVTNVCADQVCCNIGCSNTCQSCTTGTCTNVTSGEDPDTCSVSRTCVAGPLCKAKPGQSCVGGSECSTGNCVNSHCCTATSCPVCKTCGASGGCENVPDATGCGAGMMCSGGVCMANAGCSGAPLLGCACTSPGALACNGARQALKLRCTAGVWADNDTCLPGQNCDRADGQCHAIIAQCQTSTTFCADSNTLQTCNGDFTNTMPEQCAGVCSANACQPARCGDRKVQLSLGEDCDDGNTTASDGCEPDCHRSRVTALAAGAGHTCALLTSGDVRCWGDNASGQLGIGDTSFQGTTQPYLIPAITFGARATAIAAGLLHTCVIVTGGAVRCWGINDLGQLGQGDTMARTRPAAAITFNSPAVAISAGGDVTCVVLQNGNVRCWGDNTGGLLGLGLPGNPSMTTAAGALAAVAVGGPATAVSAGTDAACATLQSGAVVCWGSNGSGQLGRGDKVPIGDNETPASTPPVTPVLGPGRSATAMASGAGHTCARLDNGTVQCWGPNTLGQLGLGLSPAMAAAIGDDESPAVFGGVTQFAGVSAVFAANASTCARLASGGVRCWGLNSKGQLGYNNTANKGGDAATRPSSLPNVMFPAGVSATSLAMGTAHTCALLSNDQVRCWGRDNFGQLGNAMVLSGTMDFIGGSDTRTPDLLAPVQVFAP